VFEPWRPNQASRPANEISRLERPSKPGLARMRWMAKDPVTGLDGHCLCPGKKGGSATGPKATDRGKPGTTRRSVLDGEGMPPGLTIRGGRLPHSAAMRPIVTPYGCVGRNAAWSAGVCARQEERPR
jgi:hypothetical protein